MASRTPPQISRLRHPQRDHSEQVTNVSVGETVQSTADDEDILPVIGTVTTPDPRVPTLADQRNPTLEEDIISMTNTQPKTKKT